MSYEPVHIEIEPECINIISFPGIDRSVSMETIEKGERFRSRVYRNRRLGEFLKELDLAEGHSTGILTIQEELEKTVRRGPLRFLLCNYFHIFPEISLLGMKKPNICLFFNRYRDIIEFRENYYFYA